MNCMTAISCVPPVLKVSAGMACHVYVDFDGTIAPGDPTDSIFARFADPYWQVIEEEWQQGRASSWETMQRQVALIRATPEALDAFVDTVRIGLHAGLNVLSRHELARVDAILQWK